MSATVFRNWPQEAETKTLFKSSNMTLVETGMLFSDTEISRLHNELSNKRAVHLISDAPTLCSILLQECLDTSKRIFITFESLQRNRNMLLHAWVGGDWEWLIVFCDSTVRQSDIPDACTSISEIVKTNHSTKHAIILTASSVQQISNFVTIEHEFKFEQLSKESREMVLDKKIDFQGCEVTMRSVLQRHGNMEHVLGPELVIDLLTEETTLNIGGRLRVNEEYYAPRVLERKVWIQSNVLQNSNDVFVVDGTTMEDLLKIVPLDKTVEYICLEEIDMRDFTQDMRGRIFLLSDKDTESTLLAMCEKLKGKHLLHLVELKNGEFLWKKSSCGTESLLNYIDADKTRADKQIIADWIKRGSCEVNEESIWDLGERTVLVVAEPGMGKSSTTTQVEYHTKLADPTSWVVRINWNDHTKKLQEIDKEKFNFDYLVEFLCSAAFPESKYTDIEKILLKQALQNSGNVTVLIDGFDEISSIHWDKAAVILSELMKTKVGRVWVTSYPVEKQRLEKELSVSSYDMKRLSSQSQVQMLQKIWITKEIRTKKNFAASISQILKRINHGVNDRNFTGSPLYIMMIATAFKQDLEAHLNSEDCTEPRLDFVDWYNSFVKMILLTYLPNRQKADITNYRVLDFYVDWRQKYLKNFEKCALVATLPPSILESLHNKKMKKEIHDFLDNVQAGKIATGVVMNVVDGKPQFVHQTFAEYFITRWFSRNFQLNRSVMERILFESNINEPEGDPPLKISHSFVRNMFDRILARSCPLHSAVLDCDEESVAILLQEGYYANSVDLGGRTPLHLIAAHEPVFGCENIINNLLNHGASVNQKDNVLQWTPLHYAIKSENWSAVELLLEHKADESGLELIKQRIDDQDYIGHIAKIAEKCGHSSLLQFLGSIGVNQCAIQAAVDKDQLRPVKWPINNGADCNTLDRDGQTPLCSAVTGNRLDVQRVLIKEGDASLDVYDKKDICRRGHADSMSDEEPPPAKRQHTTEPQTNTTGGAHDGGQQFAIKMAAVIALRGMKRGDNFELATNNTDAGNFDGLVYTARGRRYFLQLKHTHNPGTNKLVHSELVPFLHNCFETYISMADKDQSKFIIYTNQHLESRLLHHKREKADVDKIFKTSDEGKVFKFTPDDNKENDVYTLLEKSLTKREEYKCLSDAEKESTLTKIKQFLKELIIFTGQKDQWELDDLIAKEIRKQDAIQVDGKEYKSVVHHFKTPLENWWRSKKRENMTPEISRNWLQTAKRAHFTSFITGLYKSCTTKFVGTEIKFSDSEISRLHTELSNNRAVHLRSDALTLCSILLLDCLDIPKCILVTLESLHTNKNVLLHAWLGGDWEWLIVFCESAVQHCDISDTCIKISHIIQRAPSTKRVIILTACSVQKISDFVAVEHEFKFEQLSKDSQEIVLDKTIDFQSSKVTMRSVLQRHGNVQHVLGPELVTDLITEGTAVNIGGTLQLNTDHYEPRFFKRKIWLPVNILRKRGTYPDIFAVSGIEKNDLVDIVPSGEEVGSFYFEEGHVTENSTQNNDMSEKGFIVLQGRDLKSSFSKLCEIHNRETLHWLKYKEGKLLWKKTRGGIENLLNCFNAVETGIDQRIVRACMESGSCEFNEQSIWELGERTVLVVAELGMGKSSTTTQVALNTKLYYPTSWVVRINWNDHTKKLQEIDKEKFNFDYLFEFLCSAAFPESKYTDIEKLLLKQALQYSGNITVLIDGFDEISSIHRDKAAVILSELMKTKVGRVWVTSYPVEKERLEKELSVSSYDMKRLSSQSQVQMLQKIRITEEIRTKKNFAASISQILKRINHGVNERNFTGSPLYITMIATTFKQDLEAHLNSEDCTEPRLDFVDWYNSFVKMILLTYLPNRQKADITNSRVLDFYVDWRQMYLKNFEKCALVATLPPSILESLHNKKMKKEIHDFLDNVQAGKIATGVVMNVVDGKPQFVHQTFAEYFITRWFSRNFQLNRSVMERILFESNINGPEGDPPLKISHSFVRNMFDRILARSCPLHSAVLDCDEESVASLLQEGYYANSVDLGGRTPLHLIAAHEPVFGCENIINNLLNHEASVNQKDNVLQWTPLHYAIKSESWSVVELLLGHKADGSGLELIKQRIDDQDYIGHIAKIAEKCGHSSLLQFLGSIGVKQCAIQAAVDKDQLRPVKWPINNGADCNTLDRDGQTPLCSAVTGNRLDVQQVLIKEGDASLGVYDKKDICRRGHADSMSDEEPPPAKRQHTTEPQTNTTGGAHDGGQQFAIKMAAVIALRGMKRGDNFELATNNTDAGNFDGLVYTARGRRYFLQLKHTHNPGTNKLVYSELVRILHGCFQTYVSVPEKDKSEFIIYTNKLLGSKLLNHKTEESDVDNIFKTSDEGKVFKFTPDDNKENDVYTLLENSLTKREEYKCLSDAEKESTLTKIKQFLMELIIFTGQKDQWELDDLIAKEIRNQDAIQIDGKEYKSILPHFKKPLENWWKSKKRENMIPEMLRNWLQRAKTAHFTPFSKDLIDICNKKLVRTGIEFSENEISRLQAELTYKPAVHLRSDALTLCSILLLECQDTSKCIFVTFESLKSNKDRLLYAWLGGHWEWLIVFCDSRVQQSDISETCLEITEIMQCDLSSKSIVILTACSVQQITQFVSVEHKFNFEQLSKKSQEMVLEKKIDFQGCEVTLGSVLQRHGNVEHVLGPELVTDLITEGTAVNIGGRLQLNTEYYEPRVFKRKIWLSLDILKARAFYPDVFAVSGIKKNDLIDIVPSGEEVGSFYFEEGYVIENSTNNYDVLGNRFIVLKGRNAKSCFLKLCQIRSTETLHWLKYKDGKLLWKETYGRSHNILNADQRIVRACMKSGSCEVNEDSIWDLGERTVLVVAEPGMGKSSTTTQVAWNTKLANPTAWVLRINWNVHTRKLQEINAETFDFDLLFEFLYSAVVPESKYTDISRNLLKQALQNSGNVTVLMDGFDEISPTHSDKGAVILSELMKTKVERVWVTSRPAQRERLEKELSVIASVMKKLPYESQKSIFLKLCLPKINTYTDQNNLARFIDKSLLLAYGLYQDRNLTGTPLYVKMIATALKKLVDTQLKSGDINVPPKIDFLYLYDRLFERIMHIQETYKKREDFTNASVYDDRKRWVEISLENFEECSLLVTLPSELNPLSKEKIQSTIQPFVDRLQAGNDSIGIVMSVVEDRPNFVHRTFAEYLTARWFSKNFESNRNILERILFDSSYGIVKDVFDRILAKGCPLHCAVLNRDTEAVETLLQEGSDVNAVDSGGRTALHLIAAQGPGDCLCEEITSSLLRRGATVDTEDKVLQWIPLRYAVTTKNWSVLWRLLKERRNTPNVELIRQMDD